MIKEHTSLGMGTKIVGAIGILFGFIVITISLAGIVSTYELSWPLLVVAVVVALTVLLLGLLDALRRAAYRIFPAHVTALVQFADRLDDGQALPLVNNSRTAVAWEYANEVVELLRFHADDAADDDNKNQGLFEAADDLDEALHRIVSGVAIDQSSNRQQLANRLRSATKPLIELLEWQRQEELGWRWKPLHFLMDAINTDMLRALRVEQRAQQVSTPHIDMQQQAHSAASAQHDIFGSHYNRPSRRLGPTNALMPNLRGLGMLTATVLARLVNRGTHEELPHEARR